MIDDIEDFEFAVADRFGKFFSRRRSTKLATPRELVDYVTARTKPSLDQRSLKQHAFYFIRAVIAAQLGSSTQDIYPRTALAELMPNPEQRRRDWQEIRNVLGIPGLPRLSRPSRVQWAITLTVAVLSYGVFLLAALALEGSAVSLVIGALAAAGLCALLFRLTAGYATEFLPASLTVGDLAAHATAHGSRNSALSIRPASRSQNLEIVRDLVRFEIGATRINLDATWQELQASARSAP